MLSAKICIAIDGCAAVGKSSTARQLAKRLGYIHVDSGAFYRAITLQLLKHKISPSNATAVHNLAQQSNLKLFPGHGFTRIFLDEIDVSNAIRTPEINNMVAKVASNPGVRQVVLKSQRALGQQGGVVMDGRDIGTVIFPHAELKLFLTASAHERARRRVQDYIVNGHDVNFENVLQDIIARDEADERRTVSPLRKADDAIELDTTKLRFEDQVEFIESLALKAIHKKQLQLLPSLPLQQNARVSP